MNELPNDPNEDVSRIRSLRVLMSTDADLTDRLEKGTKEIEQFKGSISEAAENYNRKYNEEIEAGTRKKQLLLEEGEKQGLKPDEAVAALGDGKFIPTVYTPILNFLYFMLRDEHRPDWVKIQKDLYKQHGHAMPAESEEEMERVFGQAIHQEETYQNVNEPIGMETYIYGKCTHDIFQKIKKLKAMSRGGSEHEAFAAYRAALKLCEQYNLEFDKIPCDIEDQNEGNR